MIPLKKQLEGREKNDSFKALGTGGCDWRTRRSQEKLPHVRGQGQKLGGPHARGAAAKKSYPMSEARGGGREEPPCVQGEQECLE